MLKTAVFINLVINMRILLLLLLTLYMLPVSAQQKADLLVYNATIYTVDAAFSKAEAMAVKDGKILATGKTKDLQKKYKAAETIDAKGKFIYPGFIDAHSHFLGYGLGLQTVNLMGTKSWEEVVDRVKAFAQTHPDGWLVGRGWDQNDWVVKEFPDNQKLNSLFPNRPVILKRVDGHAAIANQKALEQGGVKAGTTLTGGEAEVQNGMLTGVLIDNAIELVSSKVPAPAETQMKEALLAAQQNCFAEGLTTVSDCGIDFGQAQLMKRLHQSGDLKMRVYAMLSDKKDNYDQLFASGIIKTGRLHVRSFKLYADGALGSRGASLLQSYTDKPGWSGFLLDRPVHFDSVAKVLHEKGFQMCTHAIGDSGNRTILNIYGRHLKGKNDLRWRIEHAQVVHPNDFHLFGKYSIVPSVQPTHATSDMYWAGDRLGAERVKSAYAYKQLLGQNGWLPLGTDFPVEEISPFNTFYAAVARKDATNWPETGYQMENALTRQEAIRGMTIWAAKSQFEENEKGSLEKGKLADFIMLDKDLMAIDEKAILNTQVLLTFLNGEKVFERKNKMK